MNSYKTYLAWLFGSLAVSIGIQMALPYPYGLIVSLGVFMVFPFIYRKVMNERLGGLSGFGGPAKMHKICTICHSRSKHDTCTRCGSKQFKYE